MSAHRGVGTELGEAQGPSGTDAVGDRLGQLDHWGTLVLALGDIQNGGTSLPDRSFGDSPPSGPPKRALGLRRGFRGLRLVLSFAEAAVFVSDPALFAGTTLQPGDGQDRGIHRRRVLVLDRRCREKEQATVASTGDPSGGPEAQERRLVGHQRAGPQAFAGGIGGSILPDEVGKRMLF